MWVNVSTHQLADPGFVGTVTEALALAGLPGSALGLEITESAVMADPAHRTRHAVRLRCAGVRVAIDDFGTGYSSLSTLKTLPVDVLKVDRSFVSGLGEDVSDTRIVTAIVSMAHALGLSVVAEGVETEVQRDAIRAIGCETAQGYLFGRPAARADVADGTALRRRIPAARPTGWPPCPSPPRVLTAAGTPAESPASPAHRPGPDSRETTPVADEPRLSLLRPSLSSATWWRSTLAGGSRSSSSRWSAAAPTSAPAAGRRCG